MSGVESIGAQGQTDAARLQAAVDRLFARSTPETDRWSISHGHGDPRERVAFMPNFAAMGDRIEPRHIARAYKYGSVTVGFAFRNAPGVESTTMNRVGFNGRDEPIVAQELRAEVNLVTIHESGDMTERGILERGDEGDVYVTDNLFEQASLAGDVLFEDDNEIFVEGIGIVRVPMPGGLVHNYRRHDDFILAGAASFLLEYPNSDGLPVNAFGGMSPIELILDTALAARQGSSPAP